MLKQESLRTAVLIRAKVHWPNTLLQSGQPSSSKGKLMSCAGLLLPESWKCRPFMAGTGIPWSLKPHGLLPRTKGMCLSSAWALQSHLCPLLTCFLGGPGTCALQIAALRTPQTRSQLLRHNSRHNIAQLLCFILFPVLTMS